MILVALLPSLVAAAIFVGTFRLRRGVRAPAAVTVLLPAPPIARQSRIPDVAAARRAVAAARIDDQRAA